VREPASAAPPPRVSSGQESAPLRWKRFRSYPRWVAYDDIEAAVCEHVGELALVVEPGKLVVPRKAPSRGPHVSARGTEPVQLAPQIGVEPTPLSEECRGPSIGKPGGQLRIQGIL
jgi:hypothetical protein